MSEGERRHEGLREGADSRRQSRGCTYCLGSSREVGGGFQVSGCPSIQSDQTFTLGSSSFRSCGKAETLMSSSSSSCSTSCG